ncbi:MAG TPA: hypothetical protein VG326_05435 [Tepidisphaeraceae bacterium]|nr:hypothetical protein [Tepidisphaeraceae bacterium]
MQEIVNRLRLLSLTLVASTPAERETRLRQEIKTICTQTPRAEQAALLERLGNAFPVWPPDVPPPAPLNDDEMIERLRMRADVSELERRRIESLLRGRELSCGLSPEDIRNIRGRIAVDPNADPVVGRVVEALLAMLQTLADVDRVYRIFLQSHELGMWGLQIPRLRETVVQLLTRPDDDPARHGDLARLESSCSMLSRVSAMLVQWPASYMSKLAEQYAPSRVEASIPRKMMGGLNFEAVWNEYIRRLGGEKDIEGCKAEFISLFKKILNETAST